MKYDENNVLAEVTKRVTGTLDIDSALLETRNYLEELMPLDEILLIRIDEKEESLTIQQVMRVTADGTEKREDQFLFMIDEESRTAALKRLEHPGILVRADLEKIEVTSRLKISSRLKEMGIPDTSDVLILLNSEVNAGLIALSDRGDAYNKEHVRLFEMLSAPFEIALSNALKYTRVQQACDTLADDNMLFREAAVCLTGEYDIGTAFHKALLCLRKRIPLTQIILGSINIETTRHRVLLRVSEQGTESEGDDLFVDSSFESAEIQRHLLKHLPETFVVHVDDKELSPWDALSMLPQWDLSKELEQLGINPGAESVVLGVKSIQATVFFVFEKPGTYSPRHMEILRMLKEPFVIALHNAIHFYETERVKKCLMEDNLAMQRDMQREVGDRVIGMHQGLKPVMSMVSQVARTPSPVLLLGETGSGKEVIATAVHRISDRSAGPFISINCGAIPESLIDSELFGHEKGAFTGANERKRGRFERANKGTLFLDEVGELPPSAQIKLLRVLQEKEFERVGGSSTIQADVRLIAATNRDLPAMVQDGRFREDLWFRLNVFPIEIPPLRDRRQDIPTLAYFFIEAKRRQLNLPFHPTLPKEELNKLIQYEWPGNVRELQNAIERALILSRGAPLRFPYLTVLPQSEEAPTLLSAPKPSAEVPTFDEAVVNYIKYVLKITNGKIAGPDGAARLAGLNPSTFRSKMKKMGMLEPKHSAEEHKKQLFH